MKLRFILLRWESNVEWAYENIVLKNRHLQHIIINFHLTENNLPWFCEKTGYGVTHSIVKSYFRLGQLKPCKMSSQKLENFK